MIHLRFSENQIFQFMEDFKKAESLPDVIAMNNQKKENDPEFQEVVIKLYPIVWDLCLETKEITPYDRVQMNCSDRIQVRIWGVASEGYCSWFDFVNKKNRGEILYL